MSDLIDRQAVLRQIADRIEAATKWHEDCIAFEDEAGKTASYRALIDFNEIRLMVENLPPANAGLRTGRWKISDLPKGKMKYCSECGFGQYIADKRTYDYCPCCGAKMEVYDE